MGMKLYLLYLGERLNERPMIKNNGSAESAISNPGAALLPLPLPSPSFNPAVLFQPLYGSIQIPTKACPSRRT